MIIRHEVGVPSLEKSLKKPLLILLLLLPACLTLLSCGGASAPASHTSGIAYRAFVTNNVSAGTASAGIYIVNAATDQRGHVAPISAGNTPGMMVITPNLVATLVFSGNGLPSSDNQLTIISNAGEAANGHVTLPGMTQSFVVSPDSSIVYVAVPTAPVVDQSPGVVLAIAVDSAALLGQVAIPSVQYLAIDNGGDRMLGFSQGSNADSVAVITPSNIVIPNSVVVTYVAGFDHPVAAFFSSDDSTAYILNCGPECGGTTASIQSLDMTTTPPTLGAAVAIPGGATVGLVVNSSTMYVAGTPYSSAGPSFTCLGLLGETLTCGQLSIVNLGTMSVTNTATIAITDGYHARMAMGPNGQLFIGATTSTEIIPPQPPPTGAETRGCLSIYNTLTTAVGSNPPAGVVIPPENGDVTGIQPLTNRGAGMAQQVVYVVQGQGVPTGGTLYIYDTTIDALEYNPNNIYNPGEVANLVGNFYDVKIVDF